MLLKLYYSYKKYFDEFLVYGISQIFVILIPVLLIPILTRGITSQAFADYSLYKASIVILIPFVGLAFSTYLLKFYYINLKLSLQIFFNSVILFSTIIFIVIMTFSIIMIDYLTSLLKFDGYLIVIYTILNTFLITVHNLFLTLYRARSQKFHFLIVNILVFCLTVFPVIVLFMLDELDLERILLINSIAFSFPVLIGFYLIYKNEKFEFKIDKKILYDAISFSMPLVIYSFLAQLFIQSDKFIINQFLNKQDLAQYFAVFQVCFGLSAFGNILQLVWSPHVFKIMAKTKYITRDLFRNIMLLLMITTIFSFLYFLLMPLFQYLLLPKSYFAESNLYIWFILGFCCQVMYWILNPFLVALNKNNYFVYITVFSAVISIALNLQFVRFGIMYAAIVFFISWLIQLSLLIFSIYHANKNLQSI